MKKHQRYGNEKNNQGSGFRNRFITTEEVGCLYFLDRYYEEI